MMQFPLPLFLRARSPARRVFACLALLLPGMTGRAQPDTAMALPTVEIRSAPPGQTGLLAWRADTLPALQGLSLAERLLLENAVQVRSSGPGLLSTLSARGAGPSRTAVLWQGLNLQSPMNGVVDAALIPLWADDRLEVRFGGQSAALSTGAMAGTVQITPANWQGLPGWHGSAGAGAGAAGRWDDQAALAFSATKFSAMTRTSWQRADNDFTYRNTTLLGAPRQRQNNAFGERIDIQQFNQWHANGKNLIKTAFWHQRAYRQIPPTMTESPTDTWQRDRSTRFSLDWSATPNPRTQWQNRLALLDERIVYYLHATTDSSRAVTLIASSERLATFGRHFSLRTGLNAWWQQAKADGYSDSTDWFQQRRAAARVTADYQDARIKVQATLRQELAEGRQAPFTWSVGSDWQWLSGLTIRGQVSRNFNLPTFNDRFWRNLGNPDLKPETGYGADAGLQWAKGRNSAGITLFQLLMDNWILWQPGADGQFRPGNLRQVWSRGVECSVSSTVDWLAGHWTVTGRYRLVRATNTEIYAGSASVRHKLLPYTPQHSGSLLCHWQHTHWTAAYLHQWTGKQFTSSDNTTALPGFSTGNFLLSYTISFLEQTLTCNARLENCWNASYQIIEYRPMPGRSWHIGVVWKW